MSNPITIKGIRIESLSIARDSDGRDQITAAYSLLSSLDRVLAKQEVNGYNGVKIQPSPATLKAFGDAITAYRNDICLTIGLPTESLTLSS